MAVIEEFPYLKNDRTMKTIRAKYIQTQEDSNLKRVIDFKGLQQINQDIIGWIYIPETPIDYPILKNPYDDYYLYRDYSGQYHDVGSIFMRAATQPDFSDQHTILYGHHMIDGQMFGWLPNYQEDAVLKEHPYIYIYLPGKVLMWEIYSIYQCQDATDTYRTVFEDEEDWKEWQDMTVSLCAASALRSKIKTESPVLTLSTCTASGQERYVVHGMLKYPEKEK